MSACQHYLEAIVRSFANDIASCMRRVAILYREYSSGITAIEVFLNHGQCAADEVAVAVGEVGCCSG